MEEEKVKPKKKRVSQKKEAHAFVQKEIEDTPLDYSNPAAKRQMSHDLAVIYQDENGKIPDMKHFQRRKGIGWWKFFGVFFFLLALGLTGIIISQNFVPSGFSDEVAVVSLDGAKQVKIGEEVTFTLRYTNNDRSAFSQSNIEVRYPEAFQFVSANVSPTNDAKNKWDLGTIEKGQSGEIEIKGKFFGNVGEKQSFRIFFNYLPANFSSSFQKVVTQEIELAPVPYTLSLKGSEKIQAGAETELVINFSSEDRPLLQNMKIIFDGGDKFSKRSANPEADAPSSLEWTVGNEEKQKEIRLKGVFASESGQDESRIVKVKLMGKNPAHDQGNTYTFLEQELPLTLVHAAVNPQLTVNGSNAELSVRPGDVLNTTLSVKNNGSLAIENVVATLVFDAPSNKKKSILDWAAIEDPANGLIAGESVSETVRRGNIVWTGNEAKELKKIEPGKSFTLDIRLPIKNSKKESLESYVGNTITGEVKIEYTDATGKQTVMSNKIQMILNSDLSFELRDDESKDDQGREVHTVNWVLSNSLHELKNIEVTADVYGNVQWNADDLSVPAGNVTYDKQKQKILWKIDRMPLDVDVLAMQFSLTRLENNPTQKSLTSKVKVKALDTSTNKEINFTGEEITL